ncbi:TlpA family protein disulfide reductase [Chryseobacterium sp. Marseille-Q8038]
MKIYKTVFCIIALLFILVSNIHGQVKPLKIGDKCPADLLEYLHSQNGVSKDKSIILDFWATYCVPCLKAFPLLDSLQKQYDSELSIVSITDQNDDLVQEVLDRVFDNKKYSLTILTKNNFIKQYFPHMTIPHYVWINKDGLVKAITGEKESLVSGMKEFLHDEVISVKMKIPQIEYLGGKPLFGSNIVQVGNELKYHSLVTKYRPDLSGGYFRGENFITCVNAPISKLYQMIFGKFDLAFWSDHRLEVKGLNTERDSVELGIFTSQRLIDLYKQIKPDVAYSYELVMPDSTYTIDSLFSIAQQDLNRFFSSKGLEGHLEKRKTEILALTIIDNEKFKMTCTEENNPNIYTTDLSMKIRDQSINYLISQFAPLVESLNLPLINKTNYNGRLTVELNGDLKDLFTLNRELKKFGMYLEQRKEFTDIVVITKLSKEK